MSQDVVNNIQSPASGLHKQSVSGQRMGQGQQWKLAFEKAYLENRKDEYEKTVSKQNKEQSESDQLKEPKLLDDAIEIYKSDGLTDHHFQRYDKEYYQFYGNLTEFLAVQQKGADLISGDKLLPINSVKRQNNEFPIKQNFSAEAVQRRPINSNVMGDKLVTFHFSEEGIEIFIRDKDIKYSEVHKLILKLISILSYKGLRLQSVSINGEEFWRQSQNDEQLISSAHDDALSQVNKQY